MTLLNLIDSKKHVRLSFACELFKWSYNQLNSKKTRGINPPCSLVRNALDHRAGNHTIHRFYQLFLLILVFCSAFV